MRRTISLVVAAVFLLGIVGMAFAGASGQEYVKVKISSVKENYALKTSWGNVFFAEKDYKKLTHNAAKMTPCNLGEFVTDQGAKVGIKAVSYQAGVATLEVVQY